MIVAATLLCLQIEGLLGKERPVSPVTVLERNGDELIVADHRGASLVSASGVQLVVAELPGRVLAAHASPSSSPGRWLLGGGVPGEQGWVATIDEEGALVRRRDIGEDVVEAVAVLPVDDASAVLVSGGARGEVTRHALPDLEPQLVLHRHDGPVRALLAQPNLLISAGQDHEIVGLGLDGTIRWRLREHTAPVGALCLASFSTDNDSPCESVLVSGSDDGRVRVHDLAGRLIRSYRPLGAAVWALAFDGRHVFAGTSDGQVVRLGDDANALEPTGRPGAFVSRMLWLPAGIAPGTETGPGALLLGGRRLHILELLPPR